MPGFFSVNSRLYQALAWLSSLCLANLAALLCFAGVVTGGFGVLVLLVTAVSLFHEGAASLDAVWRAWRRRGLAATALWLFDLGFAALAFWEYQLVFDLVRPGLSLAYGAVLTAVGILVAGVNLWCFALLTWEGVRGEVGGGENGDGDNGDVGENRGADLGPVTGFVLRLRRCLLLSVGLLPRTLAGLVVLVAPVVALAWLPEARWQILGLIAILGMALQSYLVVLLVAEPLGIVAFDRREGFWD